MYFLGAIHFLMGYLSYKYLFIDFNQKTYGFDEEIPLYSVRMMKFGLLFHLLMNTFMYTNKRVLTPAKYDRDIHYRPPGGKGMGARFDTTPAFIVLMVTILTIVLYLVFLTIKLTCIRMVELQKARKRA